MKSDLIFFQLFESESSTYTYLVGDGLSREAALIDPVIETLERDLQLIKEVGVKLKFTLETHIHADHITGASGIRQRTQAQIGVSRHSGVTCADILLEDGQELSLGAKKIKIFETPGHTNTCVSFLFEGLLFTGDALLIRGTGRTDFQQGSAETLYESIHQKLFQLPEETKIYPGHDYKGQTSSTIGLEKKFNPRLGQGKSKDEFKKIMAELKLAQPKKIHEAVPANMVCGARA